MTLIAGRTTGHRLRPASRSGLAVSYRGEAEFATTRGEQFMLMATMVLLPLESHIPSVAGFSFMYVVFALLGGYLLMKRPGAVARTWNHPVFLAVYALLLVGFLVESVHSESSYSDVLRAGQMIVGAIFIAALCRDQQALRATIYGNVIAGVWMSLFLFFTSYETLFDSTATDFDEASQLRSEVFAGTPLVANINAMAFVATRGAVTAFALALTIPSSRRSILLLGIALFSLVASLLPMSRGGVATAVAACASVMFSYGFRRARTLLVVGVIVAGVVICAPEAIWSRIAFSTEVEAGKKMEARARLYTAAVEHFPEYVMTGVGAGNFWGSWGVNNGFGSLGGGVLGAHNLFFQVTIYWGLAGLAALLAVIWQAYRYLPKPGGNNPLALCLLGISVSLLVWMMAMHSIYEKDFSLVLGMLVGARTWIWPNGIVQPTSR